MSDTPRTDAETYDAIAGCTRCNSDNPHSFVPASLARNLERENVALRRDRLLIQAIAERPSDLIFWSFRYFIGRRSIHAACFARQLSVAWPHLEERVQNLIYPELAEEFERDDEARARGVEYKPLGSDSDRQAWQEVMNAIEQHGNKSI
jgi:hypothetical protein